MSQISQPTVRLGLVERAPADRELRGHLLVVVRRWSWGKGTCWVNSRDRGEGGLLIPLVSHFPLPTTVWSNNPPTTHRQWHTATRLDPLSVNKIGEFAFRFGKWSPWFRVTSILTVSTSYQTPACTEWELETFLVQPLTLAFSIY